MFTMIEFQLIYVTKTIINDNKNTYKLEEDIDLI